MENGEPPRTELVQETAVAAGLERLGSHSGPAVFKEIGHDGTVGKVADQHLVKGLTPQHSVNGMVPVADFFAGERSTKIVRAFHPVLSSRPLRTSFPHAQDVGHYAIYMYPSCM